MTLIWMTRDFSASNALALIACSRVGQKKDFPMRRFCVAVLSASTRSTHFCNGDEFPANNNSAASSTNCADLCGSGTADRFESAKERGHVDVGGTCFRRDFLFQGSFSHCCCGGRRFRISRRQDLEREVPGLRSAERGKER